MYDDRSRPGSSSVRGSLGFQGYESNNNNNIFSINSRGIEDANSTTLGNLTTDLIKASFEHKLRYFKRLKQLPSQEAKARSLSQSTSKASAAASPKASSSSLASSQSQNQNQTQNNNPNKKVFTDDAVFILEKILLEQEAKLKEEFDEEMRKRLADQHESFVRYNEEYVKSHGAFDCSYLS